MKSEVEVEVGEETQRGRRRPAGAVAVLSSQELASYMTRLRKVEAGVADRYCS